jgi:hypothetical protein
MNTVLPREGWSATIIAVLLAGCGGAGTSSGSASLSATSPATTTSQVPGTVTDQNPPPARGAAALAYDPISRTLILFGGTTGDATMSGHPGDAYRLNDTWSWNRHMWIQLHPMHTPPTLAGARLVLDPSTGQLLLISGAGAADSKGALVQQGVWKWDGHDWSLVGDNPLQMPQPAVARDPKHHQILLSGDDANYPSFCPPAGPCTFLTSIDKSGAYVWNGSAWLPAPGSPPLWLQAGTAFDPISGRVISAGGVTQFAHADTYAWDGQRWSLALQHPGVIETPNPTIPFGPCEATTDDATGDIVMACVSTQAGETTWTFDGQTWNVHASAGTPPMSDVGSLTFDAALGAVVMVFAGQGGTEAMSLWNGSVWVALLP